jgi:hypothetical protein
MVELGHGYTKQILELAEIHQQTDAVKLFSADGQADPPVVAVQVLAFALVLAELVGGGEMIFYA